MLETKYQRIELNEVSFILERYVIELKLAETFHSSTNNIIVAG